MGWLILPYLLLGISMNICSSYAVYFIAVQAIEDPFTPLPDLLHVYTPKINTYIPDYFLGLSILYALLFYNNEYHNIEENLWTFANCVMLRSFSVFLTIKPTCMPENKKLYQSYYSSLFHTTHDLMFSGHTLCFAFIGYITQTPTVYYIGPTLLVLARQHYTIDAIMAGLVYNYMYQKTLLQ